MKVPNTEETLRILLWVIGSALVGAGAATETQWTPLMEPEFLGALGLVLATVWRVWRGATPAT